MTPESKERLGLVVDVVKCVCHWGYIPLVLYLGFKKGPDPGQPKFTFFSLLWQ